MQRAPVVVLTVFCACAPPLEPPEAHELVGVLHDEHSLRRPHDVEPSGDVAFIPGKVGSLAGAGTAAIVIVC